MGHQDDDHSGGHSDDHSPDGGFLIDMARMTGRRAVLAALGLGGVSLAAAALAQGGPPPSDPQPDRIGTGADGGTCTVPAQETNGPYPADGTNVREGQTVNVLTESGVIREDLTSSFGGLDGTVDGVPFDLEVTLVALDGCTPLAGHALYLWHCDAAGRYSLYTVPGANWLRGMQVSDAAGKLRFRTILPGCYEGRWPHFHFELFASPAAALTGRDSLLVSQFALPGAGLYDLYASDPRYAESVGPMSRVSLARDNVFGDNSAAQMRAMTLALTGGPSGLTGTARIAVAV